MPSVPGSLLEAMHDQAGTVIGGMELFRWPNVPASISRRTFGRSSMNRSNISEGSAQSRPMTATFSIVLIPLVSQ